MGDGGVTPKLGNMKTLLGIVAGAGASYGIYKLISGENFRNKKNAANESRAAKSGQQPGDATLPPGSLLAKVSGVEMVRPRGGDGRTEDLSSSKNSLYSLVR